MRKGMTIVMLLAAALAMPAAADNPAWFGIAGPAPLSDPRQPIMKYDDAFEPLPARFKHRAGKFDELLDAAALKADQKRVVGFSLESLRAGDKVWGRRAAAPAHRRRTAGGSACSRPRPSAPGKRSGAAAPPRRRSCTRWSGPSAR